jgi:hypothetical protein
MNRTHNQLESLAPAVELTPADTLRGAARYLETHGWTQDQYYGGTVTDRFPPACVSGAIGMAAYGYRSLIPCDNTNDPGHRDYNEAIACLADYLEHTEADLTLAPNTWEPDGPRDYTADPFAWNDRDGQSAENVIATLRAAADDFSTALDAIKAQLSDDDMTTELADLLDTGGYLACGCHGSQRDHTCDPRDYQATR